MDALNYKRLCAQPHVMRRTDIEATIRLLTRDHPELTARLAALLPRAPVPRPAEHAGGSEADYLFLDLDPHDVDALVTAIGAREASLSDAVTDAEGLSLAGTLLDQWSRAESSRPSRDASFSGDVDIQGLL